MEEGKKNALKRELLYQLNNLKGEDETMINEIRKKEVRNLLKDKEYRGFYNKLQQSIRQGNIIDGALNMPPVVEDRIKELLLIYSGLYDEVQVVPVGTDGRAIVSVGEAVAHWGQVVATLEELNTSFDLIEMQDIKLGGYMPVSNSILEDTTVDTVAYLEELLVKAIAHGIDNGVINGVGDYAAVWEPIGILKNLAAANKVTVTFTAANILAQIGLIDIGKKEDIGEVVAIMKRMTYYKDIIALSNSSLPYPNINGMRVKFSPAPAADTIILGDFKEYILTERNKMRIEGSSDVLFLDDQTVFRVVDRYDGKPHITNAFVQITKQVA